MEFYDVEIVNLKNGVSEIICIDVDEAEETELIVLHSILHENEVVSSDPCYMSAFQDFRDQLLALGYGMRCKGAYVNAVQSPMMSVCDRIYLVHMGKQAFMKDAVGIFEYADLDSFCNTIDQINYFCEWCDSLQKQTELEKIE